jgi:uncharacterized membrane protein
MTGDVSSWSNASGLGAIYPFPGIEWILVIVGVVIWIAWHIWQIRSENAEYDRALAHYRKVGLDKALDHRGNYNAMVVD